MKRIKIKPKQIILFACLLIIKQKKKTFQGIINKTDPIIFLQCNQEKKNFDISKNNGDKKTILATNNKSKLIMK